MADNPGFSSGNTVAAADEYSAALRFDTPPPWTAPTYVGIQSPSYVIEIRNKTTGDISYLDITTGAPWTLGWEARNTPTRFLGKAYSIDGRDLDQAAYYINGTTTAPVCGNNECAPCDIHVHDPNGIVYTLDGADPAGTAAGGATSGILINSGGSFTLSRVEMFHFKFNSLAPTTPTTVTGSIYLQYYSGREDWGGMND